MNSFWLGTIEQGLIFAIMVLGVYITYKLLDFPDLSVDGSFPLGAAVTSALLIKGINPLIAMSISLLAGMISGIITGVINVKLRITNLLSGILVMIGLYSVNLRIMGKSNIHLFNSTTIFNSSLSSILIILIFVLLIKFILDYLLITKFGFILIASGDNPKLVTSLGINKGNIKILGLMISNGFVALSGSILAQYQGFSDVGMGTGIIVSGLASIILGQAIFRKIRILKPTTIVIAGSLLYRVSISFALKLGFPATDLKLITVLIIIFALSLRHKSFIKIKNKFLNGGERVDSNSKPL